MRTVIAIAVVIASSLAVPAATPPDRVNYQGVLRDAAGAPRNGSFEMIFRLFDQQFAGVEILQDRHMTGIAAPVVVTDGLFNVEIGSGQLLDGWGPGFYQTLGEAFQDYGELWLDIQIGAETLSPRLRFASAGYALNAGALAGRSADEFLDTGPDPQTKSGPLTLSGASVPGGASLTSIGSVGARVESTSGALAELARYGDGLWATSGPGPGSGGVFYAYGGTAVNALGAYTGGYFQDLDNSSWAYVANGDYGARIQGETTGAYVQTPGAASYVWLAEANSGLRAKSPASPVEQVTTAVGSFALSDPSGGTTISTASVAARTPIDTIFGPIDMSVGIKASGEIGAVFTSVYSLQGAYVGTGGYGITAGGDYAGGNFSDMDSSSYADVGYGTYKIFGTGSVAFTQNHPTEKDEVIVYNSPEGDEVATYTRGSARLAGGEARVPLGETFAWVTNPDVGLTAHLTPHGAPVPLSVQSLTTKELVVRASVDAPPNLEFDYLVYGLRIGFEETSIVQRKDREAFIPSMASHRKLYEDHPELRRHNALERVKEMRAARGHEPTPDLRASTALREAIHEFNPNVDTPSVDPAAPVRFGNSRGARLGTAPEPGLAGKNSAVSVAGGGAPSSVAPAHPPDAASAALVADPERCASLHTSPAERFRVSEPVRAGELLAIDPLDPERVHRAEGIADPRFIGIAAADSSDDEVALATSRVITVWADAASGAIAPGDLLTTSPARGLAMRAVQPASGAVFGKALDPLESGTGEIRVLWMPH